MFSRDLHISLSTCKDLTSKIFQLHQMEKMLEDERQKLYDDYRKQINNLFVEYADYRGLLEKNFELKFGDTNLMLGSNILQTDEESFFDVIRFFKKNPEVLASLYVEKKRCQESNQRLLDFIFLGYFNSQFNIECACSQKENSSRFIITLLAKVSENNLNFLKDEQSSPHIARTFESICKMPSSLRMLNKFYGSLIDFFLVCQEPLKVPSSQIESEPKKEEKTKTIKIPSRYKDLLCDAGNGSSPEVLEMGGEKYLLASLKHLTSFILDLSDSCLPQEMFLFFYSLWRFGSEKPEMNFAKVLHRYFVEGFLIQGLKKSPNFFGFHKVVSFPVEKLREILEIYSKYMLYAEEKKLDDNPYKKLRELFFRRVPRKFRNEKEEPATEEKPELEAKNDQESKATEKVKESQDTKEGQDGKDKKVENVSQGTQVSQIISFLDSEIPGYKSLGIRVDKPALSTSDGYHSDCSIHIDAHCISVGELSDLLEIYRYVDGSRSTAQAVKLGMLQASVEGRKETKEWLNDSNFFLLFTGEMFATFAGKTEKTHNESPLPEVEALFSHPSLSDNYLDFFVGRSLAFLARKARDDFLPGREKFHPKGPSSVSPDQKKADSYGPSSSSNSTSSLQILAASPLLESIRISELSHPEEIDPVSSNIAQTLYSLPSYYDRMIRHIESRFLLLYKKRKEALGLQGQLGSLRKIKRRLFMAKICAELEKCIARHPIDLCLSLRTNQTTAKDPLRELQPSSASGCREKLDPPRPSQDPLADKSPTHVHMSLFSDLLEFLRRYNFGFLCIENPAYVDKVKQFIDAAKSILATKIEGGFDKELIKQAGKYISQSEMGELLFEMMNAKLDMKIFAPESNISDLRFNSVCKVLSMFGLQVYTRSLKKPAVLEKNLPPAISALSKVSRGLTYKSKMRHLERCLQLIASIHKRVTGKHVGGDELLPIFIYCLVQSNNSRFVSSKCLIGIAMDNEDRFEQKGYILTQLEASENQIINFYHSDGKKIDLDKEILENEVNLGIHFLRRREPNKYTSAYSDAEFSLWN